MFKVGDFVRHKRNTYNNSYYYWEIHVVDEGLNPNDAYRISKIKNGCLYFDVLYKGIVGFYIEEFEYAKTNHLPEWF